MKIQMAVCAAVIAVSTSSAYAEGVALAAKIGTTGPGLELTIPVVETLNIRVGGTYLPYSFSGELSGVDYSEIKPVLAMGSALLDWHPFSNGFRISGGGVYNDSHIDLEGSPSDTADIGEHQYPGADVGTLTGKVDFKKLAPYVGIGFGNAVEPGRTWGFSFDLGVIFSGTPNVDLTATGPLSDNAEFQSDLHDEQHDIQDVLDLVTVYPVLSFGVSYNF